MWGAYGSLGCMADALSAPYTTLQRATRGTAPVSPAVLLRAIKAGEFSLAALLGIPALALTCRACEAVRRRHEPRSRGL